MIPVPKNTAITLDLLAQIVVIIHHSVIPVIQEGQVRTMFHRQIWFVNVGL